MENRTKTDGGFKDFFSDKSDLYRQYRPTYPQSLYDFLASLVPPENRHLALDIATGNGQAAISIADYFQTVLACDASQKQIQNAIPKSNVHYHAVSVNELLSFPKFDVWRELGESSCNLITLASAVHWMDTEILNQTVKFLLKNDGIYAIWAFARPTFPDCSDVKNVLEEYYSLVSVYASPECTHIDSHYENIPFPFDEIFVGERRERPIFQLELEWNVEQLLGRLRTSSRLRTYMEQKGGDLLAEFEGRFRDAWKPYKQKVLIPVFMRVGRNKK